MRIRALIRRICEQLLRDKRTLALLFLAPLLVLSLMYYLFNHTGNAADAKIGVVNLNPKIVEMMQQQGMDVISYEKADKDILVNEHLDALLEMQDAKIHLILKNSDPSQSKALQMKISQAAAAISDFSQNQVNAAPNLTVTTDYVYGSADTTYFDTLSPILIGFFVFFFVFLISGIGLLRERTTGTMERLMSTPVRRGEVIIGYLVGYGIFAFIQTVIIVVYATMVLGMNMAGSIWYVLLTNLLLAFVALSLGILLSTFASSEFQMVQFIPIVIIPQIFFAGIFPLDHMADWVQVIARIMPLYYGADALKDVMYKGLGFGDIALDLGVLVLFAALFIVLNILALKKYRKL
ncbi:ABC transporter permease [Paenibacillus dokdonensis]|uniref:ABC transporter permease n=1 Tax=Paenibacillus dokdonensis TaxID=2567944 RepID=A0ABU6GSL8_9BACL|nr:ABC transporter permease [Paenibacillus dokdonensis]MEC0242413.1 ABC transporter permease [Paenibacillus dokdonensis]